MTDSDTWSHYGVPLCDRASVARFIPDEPCQSCGAAIDARKMIHFWPNGTPKATHICAACTKGVMEELQSIGCVACDHVAAYLQLAIADVESAVADRESVHGQVKPSPDPHAAHCPYRPKSSML